MKQAVRLILGCLLLLYPLIIYWGIKQGQIMALALVILAVMIVRFALVAGQGALLNKASVWLSSGAGILLVLLAMFSKDVEYFLFYPVLVNVAFLLVFAASIRWPPTVIERLARLQDPELDDDGINYTRRVTWIWCGFFILNGVTALVTIELGMEIWTLYNGVIAYVLMGLLFAGEFAYRKLVLRK